MIRPAVLFAGMLAAASVSAQKVTVSPVPEDFEIKEFPKGATLNVTVVVHDMKWTVTGCTMKNNQCSLKLDADKTITLK